MPEQDQNIVHFAFAVDQRVITPFGKEGIVSTAAVGRGGRSYFVDTEAGGAWHYEDQLAQAQADKKSEVVGLGRLASLNAAPLSPEVSAVEGCSFEIRDNGVVVHEAPKTRIVMLCQAAPGLRYTHPGGQRIHRVFDVAEDALVPVSFVRNPDGSVTLCAQPHQLIWGEVDESVLRDRQHQGEVTSQPAAGRNAPSQQPPHEQNCLYAILEEVRALHMYLQARDRTEIISRAAP